MNPTPAARASQRTREVRTAAQLGWPLLVSLLTVGLAGGCSDRSVSSPASHNDSQSGSTHVLTWRGMNYDVGLWSPPWVGTVVPALPFDATRTRREMAVIKNDLHCNAVKITGHKADDLIAATEAALDQELEVWLVPHLVDGTADETLDYTVEIARRAEGLRSEHSKLVMVVGVEATLFMKGILDLPGDTFMDRLNSPDFVRVVSSGRHNARLNAYLVRVAAAVREVFHGPLTYGSIPELEEVDWGPFDYVGIDYYREEQNHKSYPDRLAGYRRFGKPVVVLETGVCTYRGAEKLGPNASFAILDPATELVKTDLVRDEAMQARELTDILGKLEDAEADGIFVYTFVQPYMPHNPSEPRYDFDLGSFGIVKSLIGTHGTTYPDLPWEPKASFAAVAEFFGRHD